MENKESKMSAPCHTRTTTVGAMTGTVNGVYVAGDAGTVNSHVGDTYHAPVTSNKGPTTRNTTTFHGPVGAMATGDRGVAVSTKGDGARVHAESESNKTAGSVFHGDVGTNIAGDAEIKKGDATQTSSGSGSNFN